MLQQMQNDSSVLYQYVIVVRTQSKFSGKHAPWSELH